MNDDYYTTRITEQSAIILYYVINDGKAGKEEMYCVYSINACRSDGLEFGVRSATANPCGLTKKPRNQLMYDKISTLRLY